MEISDYISIVACLIAVLSALYSRWTWSEAKKANDISQIDTLVTLKQHYAEMMQKEMDNAKAWQGLKSTKYSDGFTEACSRAFADYQQKHLAISNQLEELKSTTLKNKTG